MRLFGDKSDRAECVIEPRNFVFRRLMYEFQMCSLPGKQQKAVYLEGSIFENTIYPSIGTFRRKADLYR